MIFLSFFFAKQIHYASATLTPPPLLNNKLSDSILTYINDQLVFFYDTPLSINEGH